MNGELKHDLNNFKQLLFQEDVSRNPAVQGKRTRRGLINVLGYGLKYLFGTADAREVKRLTAVCDELHTFETQVTHADQQVTYLRTLGDMTKQNASDAIDLTRALRDSIKNFSLQMHRDEADLLDTRGAVEKQVRYSSAIREIEMAILEIKFKLTQLQESLDLTSLGKLSSVLISPYNLSVILQQVSSKLPQGMSMLTSLAVEDMYVYYAVAVVHAVGTSKSIRLFIDIPLKAADRYFEFYQVHSLLFFHLGIKKYMIDEPFTFIAVAKNRQFFAIMEPHLLANCMKDIYTVCPSDLILRTAGRPNCIIALFLGKTDVMTQLCKRLILSDNSEPIWIRSPDFKYWIYSLSAPTQVTVQCREAEPPPNFEPSYQVTPKGTGVLQNSSACYVHSKTFKLLPHSFGRSEVTLKKTHFKLPDVNNILSDMEREMLQPHFQESAALNLVDTVIERATSRMAMSGLDVNQITQALGGDRQRHRSLTLTWIFGVIAVIISLLTLLLFYKLSFLPLNNCIRNVNRTFPTRHSSQNKPKLRHDTLELLARSSETPDEQQEATLLDGARDENQGTHVS